MFSDGLLHTDMQVLADQQELIYNSSEDLPEAMNDRDEWHERESSTT